VPARLRLVRSSDEIGHNDGYCSHRGSGRGVLLAARWGSLGELVVGTPCRGEARGTPCRGEARRRRSKQDRALTLLEAEASTCAEGRRVLLLG